MSPGGWHIQTRKRTILGHRATPPIASCAFVVHVLDNDQRNLFCRQISSSHQSSKVSKSRLFESNGSCMLGVECGNQNQHGPFDNWKRINPNCSLNETLGQKALVIQPPDLTGYSFVDTQDGTIQKATVVIKWADDRSDQWLVCYLHGSEEVKQTLPQGRHQTYQLHQ